MFKYKCSRISVIRVTYKNPLKNVELVSSAGNRLYGFVSEL